MIELTRMIEQGESETVEFKTGFNKEAIETAVAFSNTRGGFILVGISNKGNVKGVDLGKESLNDWSNTIANNTEPTIIPEIRSETIEDKKIVVIQVNEYPLKPVSYRGRCFRRVSNSNRQMSPQEIAQMHLQSTGSSWDALPAQGQEIKAIDLEKVKAYIQYSSDTGRRSIKSTDNPLTVLDKLELTQNGSPTWAAILLFGKKPQSPLIQAKIHCGRFKDETLIMDDRLFEGSIIDQIDLAMEFIYKHINVQYQITGKPQREEIWDYPPAAIREAVINAVCHREYNDTADIQIKIFDDHITFWNPGLLPLGMTIEELYSPNHSSRPRNKLIAQIFYDIGLIERYGSGIQRMIYSCTEANLPEPVFEEKNNGFQVKLLKDIFNENYLLELGLNERQIKAVVFVKNNGKITNKEYQKLTEVKDRYSTIELNDLVKKEIFEKIGTTGKGTYYEISKAHKGALKAH